MQFIKLLLIIFSVSGIAQKADLSFSLIQAIEYAQQNNATLKAADLQIKAAEEKKWETISIGLPKVDATIGYNNWIKQQVSLIPAAAFDNTQSIINVVNNYFDANQINNNVSQAEGLIPIRFGTKQSMDANLSLRQLIFDGSYFVGLKSVQIYVDIEEGLRNKTSVELKKSTTEAYGNVLLAKESIRIIKGNIEILKSTIKEVQKLYENGLTEEENLEQLQITLAILESSLKNNIIQEKGALQLLNLILGIDINKPIILSDDFEELIKNNLDLSIILNNNNIKKSSDYLIRENDKVSKELLILYEKSKLLPKINAFLNSGYSGYSDTFNFTNKSQKWYGSTIFGLKMDIPIFSSAEQLSKINRAKIDLEKSILLLDEFEKKLSIQVNIAKGNYQFAVEEYFNQKRNLALAERIENKNKIKFIEGLSSSFELKEAQSQLYNSQQNYLMSMFNIISTKAKLESLISENNKN